MPLPEYYSQGGVFTLSGETGINHFVVLSTATAGVRVNTDGTVDKRRGGDYFQIDAATDYVIPNDASKTNVRFRCTNNGSALAGGSAATGSWLDITANREWFVQRSTVGIDTLNIDIEISIDSGSSTHDTGTYTGQAEVDSGV